MNTYITYVLIILLTVILFITVKDKIKALKIHGILLILSSIIMLLLIIIAKTIIELKLKNINISIITNHIFIKFLKRGLIIIILGIIEILISKNIYNTKQKTQLKN